jgi:hypothetical protein
MRLDESDTYTLKILIGFAALTGLSVGIREVLAWRSRRRVRWDTNGSVPMIRFS